MKRLGIFVFYDASGIVDSYVQELLGSLLPKLDKLAIVVNGKITDESRRKLAVYAGSIFTRENRGFDAGAYKKVFLEFMADEDWRQWDEILLFNDTFYGPVFSWDIVFEKMRGKKEVDFWGLSRYEGDINCNEKGRHPSHIQSYFLVCRKRLVSSPFFREFWNSFDDTINRDEATEQFEVRFTTYFEEKGFCGRAYMDICDQQIDMEPGCNPYICYPYELLSELQFPVIKRTAITLNKFMKAGRALDYIEKNTDYNTDLIYEHLTRLMQEGNIAPLRLLQLRMFYDTHERIFIYGHGKLGKNLADFFDMTGWKYEGFIVSEKSDQETEDFVYRDMKFSLDDGIVLALGESAFGEVFPVVENDLDKRQLFCPYRLLPFEYDTEETFKKKTIAVYGLGKHFDTYVIQNEFISDKFRNYTIAGLIDQNRSGQEFTFNGRKYTVLTLDQWTNTGIDKVVVTTGKYFDEICVRLRQRGFLQEQICLLDELVKKLFCDFIRIECYEGKKGLEIGGPSHVFSLIYKVCKSCDGINFCEDTVWWKGSALKQYAYRNRRLGKMMIADAVDLAAVPDEGYDFVLSSNNLEHIANPMKAVKEFIRVLKKGGIILIVVPNKEVTFDHDRQYTPFTHILEDYQNDVGEDDLTHLPEIIRYHDYDMDIECGGKEAFVARAGKNVANRCLHHHVFDKECLKSLFAYFGIKTSGIAKMCSNYWIVGEKQS